MKAKVQNNDGRPRKERGAKRKIIQIEAASANEMLLALCDDGSVWRCELNTGEAIEWLPVDGIPQE